MVEERPNWLKRFGWLIGIWTASVVALAVAAYAMRLVMNLMGLSTS
jgi:hypothetical protein